MTVLEMPSFNNQLIIGTILLISAISLIVGVVTYTKAQPNKRRKTSLLWGSATLVIASTSFIFFGTDIYVLLSYIMGVGYLPKVLIMISLIVLVSGVVYVSYTPLPEERHYP